MKFVVLGLGAMLLLGMVGTASAGLCPKCEDKMYTAEIGTCTQCGGHTSSGLFKLCRKCSEKLHKCEHCMAALEAPAVKADEKPVGEKAPAKKAPKIKPEAKTDALELTAEHNGKTVTVAASKSVTIRLAGNITTGYGWEVGEITGEAVKSQGKPTYVAGKHPPGLMGGGGTFVVKLRAVKLGKSTIKLVYVRPWEKATPPAETFTATIDVQK